MNIYQLDVNVQHLLCSRPSSGLSLNYLWQRVFYSRGVDDDSVHESGPAGRSVRARLNNLHLHY